MSALLPPTWWGSCWESPRLVMKEDIDTLKDDWLTDNVCTLTWNRRKSILTWILEHRILGRVSWDVSPGDPDGIRTYFGLDILSVSIWRSTKAQTLFCFVLPCPSCSSRRRTPLLWKMLSRTSRARLIFSCPLMTAVMSRSPRAAPTGPYFSSALWTVYPSITIRLTRPTMMKPRWRVIS